MFRESSRTIVFLMYNLCTILNFKTTIINIISFQLNRYINSVAA